MIDSLIYPVIQRVGENLQKALDRKDKVALLSLQARNSARISSQKAGFDVSDFPKNSDGIPIPENGVFWSISHKKQMVAGVVHTAPVGIDIELIKPVSERLFERIVSPEEAALFDKGNKADLFFKAFTAKEAVLKRSGLGINHLAKVCIENVAGENDMTVNCLDEKVDVVHFGVDGYLVAVTKDLCDVLWTVE